MRRQRNMAQMKEQKQTLEKELNKMEISNLLNVEFKTVVIRMLNLVNLVNTSTASKMTSQKRRMH